MNIDEHSRQCQQFCVYPDYEAQNVDEFYYLAGLLAEEAGEVLSLINKTYRKGIVAFPHSHESNDKLIKELGDCYWALGQLCRAANLEPSAVLKANYDKLKGRKKRGTIDGEGDER